LPDSRHGYAAVHRRRFGKEAMTDSVSSRHLRTRTAILLALAVAVIGCGEVGETRSAPVAPAPPGAWPVKNQGLVFSCETGFFKTPIVDFDREGKRLASCQLSQRGRARFDHDYALVTSGGSFTVDPAQPFVVAECKRSGELTIEALVTPIDVALVGPVALISCVTEAGERNFALAQAKDRLLLFLRADVPATVGVELGVVKAGVATYVVVTYRAGRLAGYLDGVETVSQGRVTGGFASWQDGHLVVGDDWAAGNNWPGTLEGVALFSRALTADQAKAESRAYRARLLPRRGVPATSLTARLLTRSGVPEPEQIAPYSRALVVYEYEVLKVTQGAYDQPKIRVAHWGLMERKKLPMGERPIGQDYDLVVEPFKGNPQLDSEWLSDELPAADLPLFYDVAP
jgi:hypothetical protein